MAEEPQPQRQPQPPLGELLGVARECCRRAAEVLRERAGGLLDVRAKTPFEQVTDADIEAETSLRAELRAAVPGSAVVGEEMPADAPVRDAETDVTWYVDPIDGTHNYLRGLPLACVSVGIVRGGRVVGGCVHDVFRGESFTGGEGVPLKIGGAAPPPVPGAGRLPLVFTDIPLAGRTDPREADFLRDLVLRADVRRVYTTALALAWLAAGRADLACNLGIKPWDVAAGAALVRAAGGRFTPVGGPEAVSAPGFVAARAGLSGGADGTRAWLVRRLREIHAAQAAPPGGAPYGSPTSG